MIYTYNGISYNKRPLTDDIALGIVSNDISSAVNKTDEFEKLTKPYKLGELAGQQDACPVARINGLKEYIDFLKRSFDGFRIRNAQLSGIIAFDGYAESIDDESAAFLSSCGSIAVIVKGYKNRTDNILLANGVIPLISSEVLPKGAFVLIRNIKRDIFSGALESYNVHKDKLEKINISLAKYTEKELENILR